MTIAQKFCGGCNPRYDRVKLADRLRDDFPQLDIVGAEACCPDYVVVFCGCDAKCAVHEHLHGALGKSVIASPEDFLGFCEKFRRVSNHKERLHELENDL